MTRAESLLQMTDIGRDEGPKVHHNGGHANPNIDLPSPSEVLFDIESFEKDAVNAAWFLVEMSRQEFWEKEKEPEACVRDARVSESYRPLSASKIPMNDEILTSKLKGTDATREENKLTLGHDQENGTATPTFEKGANKRSSRARGQSFKGKLRTYRTKRVKARKDQRDSFVRETERSRTPGQEVSDRDAEDNYDILDVPVKSRNFKSLSALLGTK